MGSTAALHVVFRFGTAHGKAVDGLLRGVGTAPLDPSANGVGNCTGGSTVACMQLPLEIWWNRGAVFRALSCI